MRLSLSSTVAKASATSCDMNEIALLLAILEHQRWFAVEQSREMKIAATPV